MQYVKYYIIVLAVVFGLAFTGMFIKTATTVVSAPSRVLNKTLETNNIIQTYEWFYDVSASYTSRLNQVNQYKTMLSTESDKGEKYRIRTELAAMQQTCRDLAAKYNANSEKMNKSVFKGWELPSSLSINECN